MTILQLKYVITISETGSLNKASEILYVSQPSLTSSVRELESELGITIFNRTGRACPAGQNMHIGYGTVDATVPIIYGIIMQLRI